MTGQSFYLPFSKKVYKHSYKMNKWRAVSVQQHIGAILGGTMQDNFEVKAKEINVKTAEEIHEKTSRKNVKL